MFDLAKRVCEKLGTELEFINLGSGIGIPYAKDDKEVEDVYKRQKQWLSYYK